jgi:hypothetical protein
VAGLCQTVPVLRTGNASATSGFGRFRGPVRGRLRAATAAAAIAALGVLVAPPGSASAAAVCTPSDPALGGVAGLVATTSGYAVVPPLGTTLKVYLLDSTCHTTQVLRDNAINPFDPQDLASTPDGTLWVADIGDISQTRSTIAVHKVVPGETGATRYRLRYPAGTAADAGAMVVVNGSPVIITKAGGVFVPSGVLQKGVTGALHKVGDVASVAGAEITGAALTSDGTRVALRSATSAYEFDVAAKNVAGSIVSGKPRVTPLSSPGGVIAYSSDNKSFLTTTGKRGAPLETVSPVAASPAAASPAASPAGATPSAAASPAAAGAVHTGLLGGVGINELARYMYVVGALGLIMFVAGLWGIVRHRRRLAEVEMPAELPPVARQDVVAQDVLADQTVVLPRIHSGSSLPGTHERPE